MIAKGLEVNSSLQELHLVRLLLFKWGKDGALLMPCRSTLVLETTGLVLLERG